MVHYIKIVKFGILVLKKIFYLTEIVIYRVDEFEHIILNMLVTQLCPTLCDPLDCSPPGFSAHGFSRQETGVGSHSLLQEIFPGIEHMSPTLQVDSFPFDPPEKHSEIINS